MNHRWPSIILRIVRIRTAAILITTAVAGGATMSATHAGARTPVDFSAALAAPSANAFLRQGPVPTLPAPSITTAAPTQSANQIPPTGNASTDHSTYDQILASDSTTVAADLQAIISPCFGAATPSSDCGTAIAQLRSDSAGFLSSLSTTSVPSDYAQADQLLRGGLQEFISACDAYQQSSSIDDSAFQSHLNAGSDDMQQAADAFTAAGA